MRRGASVEEIRRVYEQELNAFVRTAAAICGGLDAGRDAVQEAFLSALRGRGRFRGDGTVSAWLWSAVVRTALKQRARQREVAAAPDVSEGPEEPVDDPEEIRVAVAALPERQRLALFLRYYGDLDYRAIAEVLGVEVGTVGATLHAARRALRGRLTEVTR